MTVPGNLSSPLLATAAAAGGGGGVAIKSLRFNSADSAHLTRTPSSAGNRRTWTWSAWVKRSKLGERVALFTAATDNVEILFEPDDVLRIYFYPGSYAGHTKTVASFKDTSAWYHIVFAIDTTQTGNDNIAKIYVNGVQQEVTHPNNWTQNSETNVNNTVAHYIGSRYGPARLIDAYMADIYLIDGQQLAPTSFGAFDDNGVWQLAEYSGTFGTNGFHLNFANGSDLGADNSGNSNSFTANNLVGSTAGADVSIANATGALPIRNTTGTYGGTVATGNRTDSLSSSLQLAMPLRADLSDVSGNSYTFTNTGVTFTSDHSKFYGQSAAFFDSDKVDISNATGLGAFGTGDFTVEAYVKFIDNGHYYGRVIEFGSVNGNAFVIDGGTAPFRLRYDAGSTTVYGTTGTIPLGKWTHVAAVRSSGTLKFYVDGVEGGSHSFTHNLSGGSARIGNYLGSQLDFDGYIQDLRVYGAAKYTSNFTPPNNPTNGLPGQNLDLLFDVPTNGTQTDTGAGGQVNGNYCTLNPLDNESHTLSNGNLDITNFGTTRQTHSTILPSSGKWYAEFTCNAAMNDVQIGVANNLGTSHLGADSNSWGVISINGNRIHGGGSNQSSYGSSYTTGDLIMVALDLDNGKWYAGKNGTWFNSGNPANGTNPAHTGLSGNIGFAVGSNNTGGDISCNFGQRAWAYSAPTNFKPLCTTLLPTPTIADGSTAFDVTKHAGTGSSQNVTGLSFQPDWVWVKCRTAGQYHRLVDSVRGVNRDLITNGSFGEQNQDSSNSVSAFNSNGFSLGPDGAVNTNGEDYVAWCWDVDAGSNKTYTVKVVSDSGNKYRFDNHGTSAVTLDLAEGGTYIFDQSDSSNAGHPIRFGTSANGTDYTTGVTHTGTPGSAGAKTTLVLASGAPTLYYSCANHSGMGGQINTNTTAGSTRLSGSLNSSAYNSSQTWSNGWDSNLNSSYPGTRSFDGDISTGGVVNLNATATWTAPGSGIAISSSLRVYGRLETSDGGFTINFSDSSTSTIPVNATKQWHTISGAAGKTLTSIALYKNPAGYEGIFHAIEIDGKILLDSGVTPVDNFPAITAIVNVSPTQGISIGKYTGNSTNAATVAHDLGAKADLIIVKALNKSDNWVTYHSTMGADYHGDINLSGGFNSGGSKFAGVEPTSNLFSLATDAAVNSSSYNYVFYAFAAVPGYSSFGSYEGNGNADGAFVYTGFRPAMVMVKNADGSGHWVIMDTTRDIDNPMEDRIKIDSSDAESNTPAWDALSNGFKIRSTYGFSNTNGNTYVYWAMAENPFQANGGLAR